MSCGQVGAGAAPVEHGHLERVDRQVGAQRARGLPADDHAGEHVDDERDVHPAGVGLDVGQVGDPQPVRGRRPELALDEIGGPVEAVVALGGAHAHPATPAALQAHVGHQPLDGAASHPDVVFVVEVMPHLVGAVDGEVLPPTPAGSAAAARRHAPPAPTADASSRRDRSTGRCPAPGRSARFPSAAGRCADPCVRR